MTRHLVRWSVGAQQISERDERHGLLRQRQYVPLFRRNAAVQCIEIDLLHRRRPAALGYLEPSIQHRGKARPGRAETLINAARAPFFRTLADLVGREEP